ncbi:MAG: DAK2 domain-containing protein [Anaerolineae bacterium]|nr:DAK2 domain-containing protein [Anaerolineae bacterium]MCX8066653.1 DAK2 domain-containing protein [Anaerolineae bacterium]MDW7991053.1 DAK2 domain-containing protein [Anaerolineae bacterium]
MMVLDGERFKQMVYAGLLWLRGHQEEVNALNVFPVPDGDTGTNMVLTMQSAWEEVADFRENNVGKVAHKVAHGALMGARGNSGVILSQIWRGLARYLDNREVLTATDWAAALEEGVRTAYKGVIRPVEGTILTVAREAAEEASRAAARGDDLPVVMERTVRRAWDALARTPDLLPVLAEAGVVDAGGQGFCFILEGMTRALRGEVAPEAVPVAATAAPAAPAFEVSALPEEEYGYDVQFLIVGRGLDVAAIRRDIDAMGTSALVVGDENVVKVHVHVHDPGVPLSYAVKLGSLRDVVVEDMQAQYQEFVRAQGKAPASQAPAPATSPVSRVPAMAVPGDIAVVAVASGEGLEKVFLSLGAAAVIPGGQTMNPSTEEILRVVESVPAPKVIVLPNNGNIVLAARQAQELASREVVVIPTRSIPQGVAALLAFNYQADLKENVEKMSRAAQDVRTGEITTATRDVTFNGLQVRQGQVIGLCDDQLVVAGDSVEETVRALLEKMKVADREIVTFYYGAGVRREEAEALVASLQEAYPDQSFEVIYGGQPHYFYIISAE